ncbi:ubiquitin-conjugating enzyme E2 34-like [Gossypium arboreum]|uniref:ubiquitin-conjugating enzyme E2 34-like n=1 Tax=Gossypium arboreum TaxID=29729 RepID=UPI0022F14B00|nr:ubiquitin-conjugating enzyme E2 34-like [Gossypium arboreum]
MSYPCCVCPCFIGGRFSGHLTLLLHCSDYVLEGSEAGRLLRSIRVGFTMEKSSSLRSIPTRSFYGSPTFRKLFQEYVDKYKQQQQQQQQVNSERLSPESLQRENSKPDADNSGEDVKKVDISTPCQDPLIS